MTYNVFGGTIKLAQSNPIESKRWRKSGRSIIHCCCGSTMSPEWPTSTSTWFWTWSLGVPPVTEDAFCFADDRSA